MGQKTGSDEAVYGDGSGSMRGKDVKGGGGGCWAGSDGEHGAHGAHALPSRQVHGPLGSGDDGQLGWLGGTDVGAPSPEPQPPQSSPSGSETGSSSSRSVPDTNDGQGAGAPQPHQPPPHVEHERSTPRSGKGEDKAKRGSGAPAGGPASSGKGGRDWLRAKQGGGKRRRGGGQGHVAQGRQPARPRPSAEQLALNKALTSLDSPGAILEALAAAAEAGTDLNATNLTTGLHRIASRGAGNKARLLRNPRIGALLQAVYARLQENPSEFLERELASVAWAVGKLEVRVGPLLTELRAECVRRGPRGFNWHDVSNITWAHAVAAERGEGWEACVGMLARDAEERPLEQCAPQALSNIVWALGTLGVQAPALLDRLSLHAVGVLSLSKFKPQEVSALAWGMAVGGHRSEAFFGAVEEAVVSRDLEGYNAQKMASILCAFAEAGCPGESLFDMCEEAIIERAMAGFNPSNTASVAWSFARSGLATEDLLTTVEERVWQIGMQGFEDAQLVLLVWALAAAKYRGPSGNNGRDTLSMVEVELRRRKIKRWPDENLATVVWAFTRQGHPGGGGLVRVQKELLKRGWLEPQREGRFAWSLSNRRMHRRPNPPPPRPATPDGATGGLQQMGFQGGLEVVVGGGCWAVEGCVAPREGGGGGEGQLWASSSSEDDCHMELMQLGGDASPHGLRAEAGPVAAVEATWARPCAR